jgi:endonuclease/exonuclease/phosphatase family metal-dependent hydrolase
MPKSILRILSKKMLVVANLATAFLFTLACHGKYLFTGGLWPMALLPLTAVYLLALLAIFLVTWLLLRSKWSLIFPIVFLLNLGPIRHLIPFRAPASFVQERSNAGLRVMSWNVAQFDILFNRQQPSKKGEMTQLVNSFQPDIVCFQEMVAGDSPVNLNTPYYRKYSFFPIEGFAEELKLPHHFYSYNPREDFLIHQHFGIAVFSRYPIVNAQKIIIDEGGYNNLFQFCDIVAGTDTFRIFNIHLQSLKFSRTNLNFIDNPTLETSGDVSKSKNILKKFRYALSKRKKQADRVREEIDRSPYPVIVCGDFNDVPNSYAYQKVGEGLQNCFTEKGAGIGRTFSKIAPTLRIDNIFCAPVFSVGQFTRVEKELSDHYPVVADIRLNKN